MTQSILNFFHCSHHHNTGLRRHKCSSSIEKHHYNIVVLARKLGTNSDEKYRYELNRCDAIQTVLNMKSRKVKLCWFLYVCSNSIILIEAQYQSELFDHMWEVVRKYFDRIKPCIPSNISEIKQFLLPLLDKYISEDCTVVAEFPKMIGHVRQLAIPRKFSAYHIPTDTRDYSNVLLDSNFTNICIDLADEVEQGFNFLRVEASEIIAFVAKDSD